MHLSEVELPSADELNLWWAKVSVKWLGGDKRRRLWLKIAKMLDNGAQIMRALESIRDRWAKNSGENDPWVMFVNHLLQGMSNGKRLSEAADGWVTHGERMMISAGEQSGELTSTLNSLSIGMKAQSEINGAIIKGSMYPAILVVALVGVLYMFSYKVIPSFASIVKEDAWVGMAATTVFVARVVHDWLIIGVSAVCAGLAWVFWSFGNWDGNARIAADRFPPYSIYRLKNASQWLISLAAMAGAGRRIEDALVEMSKIATPWLANRIDACLVGMRSGLTLGNALESSGYEFPDREVIDDLAVYAEQSGVDESLLILGREMITSSVERIKDGMGVVFAASIVGVAIALGFFISGLIAMELQMSTVMQHGLR